MAGWSKRVDGSGLECLSALEKTEDKLGSEVGLKGSTITKEFEGEKVSNATGLLFIKFLSHLLKQVYGPQCFRPMPPMLGDKNPVDLFKLYAVVRERGGYEKVSRNGLWGLVAEECGFDSPSGLPLKLVYAKYLDSLDRWLLQTHCKGKELKIGVSMEMDPAFKDIIDKILEINEINGEVFNADLKNTNAVENVIVDCGNEQSVTAETNISVQCVRDDNGSVTSLPKEDGADRKRRQESFLEALNWAIMVARDPGDPSIGHLPYVSKWKSYGTDKVWKQVLLMRKWMLLDSNTDSSYQHSIWQKSHKMTPSLYEVKTPVVSERVRCSQRIIGAKEDSFKKRRTQLSTGSSSTSVQSEEDPSDAPTDSTEDSDVGRSWNQPRKIRRPVGRNFQADVPEWTGEIIESDSKWLGTQIWPLPKDEKLRVLIERDPIGKGRQDTCGCPIPGSYTCVKFHITEKRSKVENELGSAFKLWKLDSAGDEVANSWTKEEEKKFEDIVKSQSPSKCFWDEIFKEFPTKSRDSLVSYHFNVFLLRRRGHQNRFTPTEIDSDDDESRYGPRTKSFGREVVKSSNSIFCSPAKAPQDT
ncbi:PREDICTED: AT-rich interactive domain-containing protein 1 [Ipomoea nil]|uniref:AT-rich interactive domain-containing protein 1 n=1 Tax=Ipomoea nil TaxID=35883 RepID=UPI000900EC91|nr:PREDICTED: AT-rich interactive domain-containing protein 1 [Ipomoea nil]